MKSLEKGDNFLLSFELHGPKMLNYSKVKKSKQTDALLNNWRFFTPA